MNIIIKLYRILMNILIQIVFKKIFLISLEDIFIFIVK